MRSLRTVLTVCAGVLLTACGNAPSDVTEQAMPTVTTSSANPAVEGVEAGDPAERAITLEIIEDQPSLAEATIVRGDRIRFSFSTNFPLKQGRVVQAVYRHGELTVQELIGTVHNPTAELLNNYEVNYLLIDPALSILDYDDPEAGFVIGCSFGPGANIRGHRRLAYEDSIRIGKRGYSTGQGVFTNQDLSQRYVPLAYLTVHAMEQGKSWVTLPGPRVNPDDGKVILESADGHLAILFFLDLADSNDKESIADWVDVRLSK